MKLNSEEKKGLIKKALVWLGTGIAAGIALALVLFALAYVLEILNCVTCGVLDCSTCHSCGCNGLTCGDADAVLEHDCGCTSFYGLFGIWSGKIFGNTVIFCSIAGAVVGLVYGIAMAVQEYREICKFKEAEKEAEKGDAAAQYQCGSWLMKREKYEAAKIWLEKAVEQGHTEAMEMMCDHGISLIKDKKAEKEAEDWFVKAATQGHTASKAYLGNHKAQYEYALTRSNLYEKKEWLEKAVRGYEPAMAELIKVKEDIDLLTIKTDSTDSSASPTTSTTSTSTRRICPYAVAGHCTLSGNTVPGQWENDYCLSGSYSSCMFYRVSR